LTDNAHNTDGFDLFDRLAAEISVTHRLARQLEEALAGMVASPKPGPWPAELQHVDQIVQRLAGLTVFCAALAKQAQQGRKPDTPAALGEVHLLSLAEALGGGVVQPFAQGGEVEMF
jgi:hypothetical protein